MKRHFYISDNLDDLAALERELEAQGLSDYQIHVFSQDEAGLASHRLHAVADMMKRDVWHAGWIGAAVGVLMALLILLAGYLSGGTASQAGWLPFVFLAIVALGFCAWEGGLYGIQQPHVDLAPFYQAIAAGKHVFFVDVTRAQEKTLQRAASSHRSVQDAGEGPGVPDWLLALQLRWRAFVTAMP